MHKCYHTDVTTAGLRELRQHASELVRQAEAGAVAAELNRYAYTGHGAAGLNWLETIWPGNDQIKAELITKLRQTHAKSAYAEDIKSLASGR